MIDRTERDSRKVRRRAPLGVATLVVAALVVGLAIGFVSFARTIVTALPPPDPRADGIVVLTGGSARLNGALSLLAGGRAERLLISGVNPAVTRAALAEQVGEAVRPALSCCVDIDHARDTSENAAETRRWIDSQGFSSLIVVTSDYHMPRSMAELAGAMPEIDLIPYPVSNPDLRLADWWRNPESFSLLAREYGKFLVAEARQLLPPASSPAAAR
ncbi:MAG: YdcF family protein [Hyphomicrobiales bacterium]|nr:YdcF family protein [Hyphomicrobiales bacterium]